MALDNFLREMDERQRSEYKQLSLFDTDQTGQWSDSEKQYFTRVFYHTRGHFDRLLWTRLVYAPTANDKRRILKYISEEAGLEGRRNGTSHEKLFAVFAESLGVDVTPELTEEEDYLPFAREFNSGLIKWFRRNDWENGEVGFAAYERLDNVDYEFMEKVAKSMQVPEEGMTFFKVHKNAKHFEETSGKLPQIWQRDEQKVRDAFDFIYAHQRRMWKGLSDAMEAYTT